MASRFNAVTGQLEDDGLDLSGFPLQRGAGQPLAPPVTPIVQTTETSGGGSSSQSSLRPTRNTAAIEGQAKALDEERIGVARSAGQAKRSTAEKVYDVAGDAEGDARLRAADAAERAPTPEEITRIDADLATQREQRDRAREEHASAKPKEFERDSWATVGMLLGAVGQALTGRQNAALEILGQKEKTWYEREQDRINRLADIYAKRRVGVADAEGWRKQRLADLDGKYLAMGDLREAQLKKALAAKGMSDADIETNAGILAIRGDAIKRQQEADEKLMTRVQSTTERPRSTTVTTEGKPVPGAAGAAGGKANGEEQKGGDFVNRMVAEEKTLRKLQPMSEEGRKILLEMASLDALAEKNPGTDWAAKALDFKRTAEQKLNDNDRQAYAAGMRMADASRRFDSGAAITAGEFLTWYQMHLPQPGDKPADLRSKAEARRRLIEGAKLRAGPLGKDLDTALPDFGSAASAPDDQEAVTWAKAHPTDPRAAAILQRLGGK